MKLRKVITTAGFIMASITPANAELYMCQSCPAGTYSDGTMASCKNCLTTGVANCDSITGKATSCKPGYGLSNGTCSICPAGTYSAGGTTSCSSCPTNYYQPQKGQSSCLYCNTTVVVYEKKCNRWNVISKKCDESDDNSSVCEISSTCVEYGMGFVQHEQYVNSAKTECITK